MPDDLWQDEPGQTPLTEEEKLQLRPSLSTRAQLNAGERLNIHAARLWAMRRTVLRRPDLITDAFARELHRRMFNQIWRWAGKYRTSDRNLGWGLPAGPGAPSLAACPRPSPRSTNSSPPSPPIAATR
jgi:fido (protein-threonine AMPylation protein)